MSTTNSGNFRARLDAVLRTRNVEEVKAFLIQEGQWDQQGPADPEFAMWMMIGTSPALRELQPHAHQWLVEHGHEAEANALIKKAGSQRGAKSGQSQPQKRSSHPKAGGSGKADGQNRQKSPNIVKEQNRSQGQKQGQRFPTNKNPQKGHS